VLEVEALDYARLEVCSPGLDRVLRKPADWDRYAGSEIELVLREPFQGRRKWKGRLLARTGGFSLLLPPPPAGKKAKDEVSAEQTLDFTLDEVREARLVPVIDFKGRRNKRDDATEQDGGQNR